MFVILSRIALIVNIRKAMDIYPLGHSSFKIKGKNATVVTDPFDPVMVGLKFPKIEDVDIVTVSHSHKDHDNVPAISGSPFVVKGPGEYEVKGVTIVGLATYHDDKNGGERGRNVIYKFTTDGLNLCHLGDLGHKLSDATVEEIGDVDILFVPTGGVYTIDAKLASQVVAQIEPYVVIPMHYMREGLDKKTFEKLDDLPKFLKEMGAEGVSAITKFSVSKDKLPENTTVVVLE